MLKDCERPFSPRSKSRSEFDSVRASGSESRMNSPTWLDARSVPWSFARTMKTPELESRLA